MRRRINLLPLFVLGLLIFVPSFAFGAREIQRTSPTTKEITRPETPAKMYEFQETGSSPIGKMYGFTETGSSPVGKMYGFSETKPTSTTKMYDFQETSQSNCCTKFYQFHENPVPNCTTPIYQFEEAPITETIPTQMYQFEETQPTKQVPSECPEKNPDGTCKTVTGNELPATGPSGYAIFFGLSAMIAAYIFYLRSKSRLNSAALNNHSD